MLLLNPMNSATSKSVDPFQQQEESKSKPFKVVVNLEYTEKQVITVLHNGTFYVLEFGGHFNTFINSGEKEIGQHIIESINWTQISPDLKWSKYHNSTLGLSMEYPSGI